VTNVGFTDNQRTDKALHTTGYRGNTLPDKVWQIDPALQF